MKFFAPIPLKEGDQSPSSFAKEEANKLIATGLGVIPGAAMYTYGKRKSPINYNLKDFLSIQKETAKEKILGPKMSTLTPEETRKIYPNSVKFLEEKLYPIIIDMMKKHQVQEPHQLASLPEMQKFEKDLVRSEKLKSIGIVGAILGADLLSRAAEKENNKMRNVKSTGFLANLIPPAVALGTSTLTKSPWGALSYFPAKYLVSRYLSDDKKKK